MTPEERIKWFRQYLDYEPELRVAGYRYTIQHSVVKEGVLVQAINTLSHSVDAMLVVKHGTLAMGNAGLVFCYFAIVTFDVLESMLSHGSSNVVIFSEALLDTVMKELVA